MYLFPENLKENEQILLILYNFIIYGRVWIVQLFQQRYFDCQLSMKFTSKFSNIVSSMFEIVNNQTL